MKTNPRLILYLLAALASLTLPLVPWTWSQEPSPPASESQDLDLIREAVNLLKEAKLSDKLEDRRLLQDLDLNELPARAEDAIEATKAHLRELQKQGVIAKEAIDTAAAAVGASVAAEEANASATDILGPAPQPAPRVSPLGENGVIHVENSSKFTGNLEEGILVFEGDVLVSSDQEFTLRCDKLEVFLDQTGKALKRAIATGRMVVIEGSGEDGPMEARCQLAIYENDVMYLRLWPEVSMPGRLMAAQNKDASIKLVIGADGQVDPEFHGNFAGSLRKPEAAGTAAP